MQPMDDHTMQNMVQPMDFTPTS